jgi:hypothetical protein
MKRTEFGPKGSGPKADRPKEDNQLTQEKRKEIEDARARGDLEFLRQAFASNNQAVSEYAERFLEQVIEQMRSDRDRSDAFLLKKKISASSEPEPEQDQDQVGSHTVTEP